MEVYADKTRCPLISVIIPCYNGESFIRDAINSVISQTYNNIEIIVVDDGSTDSSPGILEAYGEKIIVIRQNNSGLPSARNAGIAHSNGDFIAFLDADDYWHPSFLEKSSSALIGSSAGIAYCGWQNVGVTNMSTEPFIPPDYEHLNDKKEKLFENTRWPVHAALTRRTVVNDIGGFNPKWTTCEDFAFWIQAAIHTELVLVPEVLVYYRHHDGTQMSKNRVTMALNHWRIQKEYIESNPELHSEFGKTKVAKLMHGELLRRGYICYWERDLVCARKIFRTVMKTGYGSLNDWKYMLPSLLPIQMHRFMLGLMS